MPKNIAKNLPRDVFLYLLSIITMVGSAVSFGVLLFQYINIYLPDLISDPYFSKSAYFSTIRTSLAALMVIFPVYVWVTWFLKRDIAKSPEKRELRIRKWLLYLTLFVAALVIIGDLVVLIQNFLSGELSLRFMLKIISILFIAGSIFGYYFYELRERIERFIWMKFYVWVVVAAVVASIVAGFWIAGSPQNQRLVRFDERRISDLQIIQSEIINYWQVKEKLPDNLGDLTNNISGFVAPMDPETVQSYEYIVSGTLNFKLCATFDTSNFDNSNINSIRTAPVAAPAPYKVAPVYGMNSNWQHPAGRFCFERVIDPAFYPPINPKPSVK